MAVPLSGSTAERVPCAKAGILGASPAGARRNLRVPANGAWRNIVIRDKNIVRRYKEPRESARVSERDYRALAELRYVIRRFLSFSAEAARAAGIEPQQHQLLLVIKGLPAELAPTIGVVAERLQLHHNSAVELVQRAEERGMVKRRTGEADRRQVLLQVTPRGERLLRRLSVLHRAEFRSAAPVLVAALEELTRKPKPRGRRRQ
jgi:DNA-binding MarR family transcriptional regulator